MQEPTESDRVVSDRTDYVLFSTTDADPSRSAGKWRIMLGKPEGEVLLDVDEVEPEWSGDRLELLSVIRGLEAVEGPATVTLFTNSRYVQRGVRFGLESWRRSEWRWERFGRMVPIANADLWKRLDQALQYHELDCRYWCFDSARETAAADAA